MPMSVSLMSVYLSVRLSLHLAKGGEPETYYITWLCLSCKLCFLMELLTSQIFGEFLIGNNNCYKFDSFEYYIEKPMFAV